MSDLLKSSSKARHFSYSLAQCIGLGRGWDGYMASTTWWTRIWANSGREWRTEGPDMVQSMGLQRVRHDLATEQHLQYDFIWRKDDLQWAQRCGNTELKGSEMPHNGEVWELALEDREMVAWRIRFRKTFLREKYRLCKTCSSKKAWDVRERLRNLC